MNHGFTEVSHFMYACLSLVMVGNRRGSAWQALGLGKGKQWWRKHFCCQPLPSQKNISLCLGKIMWEKMSLLTTPGSVYWCVVLHLSPSSLFRLLCQLALTLPHSHSSQLSWLFLPQDIFIVTAKHVCCTSSH